MKQNKEKIGNKRHSFTNTICQKSTAKFSNDDFRYLNAAIGVSEQIHLDVKWVYQNQYIQNSCGRSPLNLAPFIAFPHFS